MSFNRINVIGASGTGKTTLASALSERLKFPLFDADDYYHLPTDPPYQKQRPPEERLRMLVGDLSKHPSWILTGMVGGWGPHPVLEFSLVVFLYLPPEARLERLRKRELQRFGPRIISGGDMEKNHKSFMDWASGYDTSMEKSGSLLAHGTYLKSLTCRVLRIDKVMTTAEQTQIVADAIGK